MEQGRKVCCFFGHRKISNTDSIKIILYEIIETLILKSNVDTFLFGSRSEFDSLCRDVVTELKEKYPYIKRIYVRAEYQCIDEEYKNYLLESCEETYYPERARNAGRAVYVQRNYEMIEKSDICIVYYKDTYLPPERKNIKRDLFEYQPKSGTGIVYQYAVKKKKCIINLA